MVRYGLFTWELCQVVYGMYILSRGNDDGTGWVISIYTGSGKDDSSSFQSLNCNNLTIANLTIRIISKDIKEDFQIVQLAFLSHIIPQISATTE